MVTEAMVIKMSHDREEAQDKKRKKGFRGSHRDAVKNVIEG